MARRVALEIVLIAAITVAISWLILGVVALAEAVDPLAAFVDQAPRLLFGLLGIAIGLFVVFVTIGSIALRRRSRRSRIVSHLLGLVLAVVINVALLALVTVAVNGGGADSWGMLVLAIAGAASVTLLVAGITAILLVNLVILRPKPGEIAATSPENSPS